MLVYIAGRVRGHSVNSVISPPGTTLQLVNLSEPHNPIHLNRLLPCLEHSKPSVNMRPSLLMLLYFGIMRIKC